MAFLFQNPKSPFWQAGWKDENGKRVNRSTKVLAKHSLRKKAQKVADAYEGVTRDRKSAKQIRKVISELHQEITGQALATSTVKQYVEQFISMKKGEGAPATVIFYRTATNDFLRWLGERADIDLNDIRAADMSAFRNDLLTRISETTASNKIKALRYMFRTAQESGLCMDDPTASMKMSRKGKKQESAQSRRAFTIAELKIIKESATGEWRSMIVFGLYTGQRLGDLATLRWSNLDLINEELRLTTGKTNRSIRIPLARPLVDHIGQMATSDDPTSFLHPALAETYQEKGAPVLSNQFGTLLANCGLRKPVSHRTKEKGRSSNREIATVSFHSLRATAVTLLHEAGIPAATVQEWVGHDSTEVHRTYIKIGRETLQKASDALPTI